ncbi:hypothetical protein BLA60_24605 [Actinophytocola xinjiangensis]|uniref:Peptidase S1A alpha-lytic prodomain domain-containing protein n=1 Tax=Actinophytocola xinjiangensis TaxID=485602 RepID=A0A7Z1AXP3_9PSEU|nr:S1 family peptidase [Actinophytocola xinjiangensis]OLF08054.1 hypothetical protein BLA60_24605 [Actinophytocola xinjiangensis]
MRHPRILLVAATLALTTAVTPAAAVAALAPDDPLTIGPATLTGAVTDAVTGALSATLSASVTDDGSPTAALNLAAANRPWSVTGWHTDPRTGEVTVSVFGSADGVADWAADSGVTRIAVEHVATAPRPYWDLVGGQLIYSGAARCTLGFNAHAGDVRYVLSAGHCVAGGSTAWYGVGGYIGPGSGSSFPTNDYGLIRVASADAESTPLVDRYGAGGDVTITGSSSAVVGSSVCSSNPVSGWNCGTVTATNTTVCYQQGCVYQLIRTNMCSAPGGSGAPVVTNPGAGSTVRAIGMVAGGSGNCTTGGVTYAQPIQEVLAVYGLTLYTG